MSDMRYLGLALLTAVSVGTLVAHAQVGTRAGAPLGGWVGTEAGLASRPPLRDVTPRWRPAYAARFARCGPRQRRVASELIVVDLRANAERMPFATAWARNHNADAADDVWVVGWCA